MRNVEGISILLADHFSRSKDIMTQAGVPCIPGYHGSNQDAEFLKVEASKIGYPVLLKAVKGGGGKGMRIVMEPDTFNDQLKSAKSEALSSFGDDVMLVEKYITTPRHIEVQVFADQHGNCVALGERDCSLQRRHQKILEESPAPHLDENIRQDLWHKACAAALAVGYQGAGTVEFIFDNETRKFFFMEMNTRLQVEHPVTEMITGEDLVRWQIIVAEGGKLPLTQEEIKDRISARGWAIEARIYAENPDMLVEGTLTKLRCTDVICRNFVPDSGRLNHLQLPRTSDTVRVDAGFVAGDEISSHYDPMIAKLIVRGPTRDVAIQKLHSSLNEYEIAGPITNIEFLKRVCVTPAFIAGDVETGFIAKWKEPLFAKDQINPEVYAQAALGTFFLEQQGVNRVGRTTYGSQTGFGPTSHEREYSFSPNDAASGADVIETATKIRYLPSGHFDVMVGGVSYRSVASQYDGNQGTVTTYFPHARLATRLIADEGNIALFHQGKQHRLRIATPSWIAKALGIQDSAHSVLAPMPCKILRVEVAEGEVVKKGQALVVIESMKMETVIRSPQDGVVFKVMHQAGVSFGLLFATS